MSLNTRVQAAELCFASVESRTRSLRRDRVRQRARERTLPLLQVDHLGLGVRIISVLHRQWNLDNVTVDHPVVHLIVDQTGENNLPKPQSSSNSNTNIFDLAIRHILLDRGEVYYNDRKSALTPTCAICNSSRTTTQAGGGRYFGSISYRDGHLQYGDYAPMQHD